LAYTCPELHVPGSALSPYTLLTLDGAPPLARSRYATTPPVPSSASQYFVPAVTLTGDTLAVCQVPPATDGRAADVRRVPGEPEASEYNATVTLVAPLELSR
jgi:hypothetical protein